MPGKTEPENLVTLEELQGKADLEELQRKVEAVIARCVASNITEKPVVTYNIYSKPASRPSIASIHEKYRIPWRDEPAPSFIDGFVSSFDLLGASSPKAKEPPRRSRRHSRLREILTLLAGKPESRR